MRDLMIRGMLAGVCASVFALAFAAVVGEPTIERAIAFEATSAAETHGHDGDEHASAGSATDVTIPRSVQRGAGLAVGLGMLGVASGGVFAVFYALARGRLGVHSERATALVVALLAFGALYLVPFLKYPANPPAVGDPETIQARTVAYLGIFVISLVITGAAIVLQRRLAHTHDSWTATLIAAGAFAIAFALAMVGMPSFAEAPSAFPVDALWQFRLASIGTQLVMWLGIGLVFGFLSERAARGQR